MVDLVAQLQVKLGQEDQQKLAAFKAECEDRVKQELEVDAQEAKDQATLLYRQNVQIQEELWQAHQQQSEQEARHHQIWKQQQAELSKQRMNAISTPPGSIPTVFYNDLAGLKSEVIGEGGCSIVYRLSGGGLKEAMAFKVAWVSAMKCL